MNADVELSARVRNLLSSSIHTLEELDVLMLLRSGPVGWSPKALCARLLLGDSVLGSTILALMEQRLIVARATEKGPEYLYAPGDTALAQAVNELLVAYTRDRIAIVVQLSQNAIARARDSVHKAQSRFPPSGERDCEDSKHETSGNAPR